MSATVGGLRPRGRMVVVGASADPMQIPRFSVLQDVRPAIETYPLKQAAEGYAHMISGDARFRVVLTTGA